MRENRPRRVVLQKMIRYCDEITQMLSRHQYDRDAFERDTEFQFACGMCIIQLGELVGRLDAAFTGQHPEVPWRLVKGLRNVYAHDYDIVDNDIIWETITGEIPELREALQAILRDCND